MMLTRVSIAAVVIGLSACGGSPPAAASDVDLAPMRAAFHCGAAHADEPACRALDAFAAAGPVVSWPTGSDVQIWIGPEHCVQPAASADYATNELVYLRAGAGSPPNGAVPAARVLSYAAVFASTQTRVAEAPVLASGLAAFARGETPDAASLAEVWRGIPENADGAYRTLVRAPSGVSIGDGDPSDGIWFLRSDGQHLLLVGPTMQGGCATELFRVPPR